MRIFLPCWVSLLFSLSWAGRLLLSPRYFTSSPNCQVWLMRNVLNVLTLRVKHQSVLFFFYHECRLTQMWLHFLLKDKVNSWLYWSDCLALLRSCCRREARFGKWNSWNNRNHVVGPERPWRGCWNWHPILQYGFVQRCSQNTAVGLYRSTAGDHRSLMFCSFNPTTCPRCGATGGISPCHPLLTV